jgi:hypothetical protein
MNQQFLRCVFVSTVWVILAVFSSAHAQNCPHGTVSVTGLANFSSGDLHETYCVNINGGVTAAYIAGGDAFSMNMPYLGKNGLGPFAVSFKADVQPRQQDSFLTAGRFDMFADSGGVYGGLQTAFPAITANTVLTTKGQGISLFGYVKGFGIGNAIFGNSVVECWGGSADVKPGAYPECSPLGEFEAGQGSITSGPSIFRASVTGSPMPGATVIGYKQTAQQLASESVLGQRYLLNSTQSITSGFVSSVSANLLNFTGTKWTTVSPSPVGQYIKLGSTSDLYQPPCSGDDVLFDSLCVGHWYKVTKVNSDTQLEIEANYDIVGLTNIFPASYVLEQGAEIQSFDTKAHTITITENTYSWHSSDMIYSPPNHLMGIVGLNLILHKAFRTGAGSTSSDGIRVINLGPGLMDRAIWITGQTGTGNGGYRRGIVFNDFNGTTGIDMSQSNYADAAIRIPSVSLVGTNNKIKFGQQPDGPGQLYYDGTSVVVANTDPDNKSSIKLNGTVAIRNGIAADGGGLKHSRVPTGLIAANTTVGVKVQWATQFADTNYTLSGCSVEDPSGFLQTYQTVTIKTAASFTINVKNTDNTQHAGTLDCIAVHD